MNKVISIFLSVSLVFLLIGCSSEYESYEDNYASDAGYETGYEEPTSTEAMGFDNADVMMEEEVSGESVDVERKIIKNAYIDLLTNNFDDDLATIRQKVSQYDAEISHSEQWGSADYFSRYITFTVRIPAENYQAFLDGISVIGEINSLNESTEDVTTQYIDLEARIESLEAQEDRLIELLEIAETVTEIMEIESQLSYVRYERESYTQQRLYLERQVSMSTIVISLSEQEEIIITETGFLSSVVNSFTNGFFGLGSFFTGFIIVLAGALPALVVLGVLAFVIVSIVKKVRSKRKK